MDEKERIICKVATVSKWNGGSIAVFAGLCTMVSLAFQDWFYVLLGIAITSAGAMELTGRNKLLKGQADAGKWLKGSQLWLMGLIIVYACFRIFSFDTSDPLKDIPSEIMDTMIMTTGMNEQELGEYVTLSNYAIYGVVMMVSFFYQGGMWFYYKLKTAKLAEFQQAVS